MTAQRGTEQTYGHWVLEGGYDTRPVHKLSGYNEAKPKTRVYSQASYAALQAGFEVLRGSA